MKPETDLDAQTTPLVWWRVEKTNQEGPVVGKGVSVRLAGPRPDFLENRSDSSQNPSAERGTYPARSAQLLLMLTSAPEPELVSVKQIEPLGQGRSPDDPRYAAVIRGVTRAALASGAVALPVRYEPCCTRIGVLGPVGAGRGAKRGPLTVGSRLRLSDTSPLYTTVREVHELSRGSQLAVLSRSVPLVPGATLVVDDSNSGGRPVLDDRAGTVMVLGCYPGDPARKGAIRELIGTVADRPPRPMNAAELYRVLGVSAVSDLHPPAPDAVRIGGWWVSPSLLKRCEQAAIRSCRRPGGARSRELRDALRREGIGPALGDALLTHARTYLIERRGSVWLPVGSRPGEFLSLPARTLLARLETAGTEGVDLAAERALAAGGEQLAHHGLAILLGNGRLFSLAAYEDLTTRTMAGIKASDGEIHQRDLSAVLGLSRNSTRALVGRMVQDGLIERASAVHVRAPADGGHT